MKKYLVVFVGLMCLVVLACSTGNKSVEPGPAGVAFQELNLDDAITQAQAENKIIVLDIFSPT